MEFKSGWGFRYCSAPNRYRKIEKEVFNTPKEWVTKVIELQKKEFPEDASRAMGMDINPENWDEILILRGEEKLQTEN